MSFEAICQTVRRQPVIAGMARMAPAMRERVDRLLARFEARDDRPLDIEDEAAAVALWGVEEFAPYLAWHAGIGGLARVVDLLVAAAGFDRVVYEWDASMWGLRRARPLQGLIHTGPIPWLQLRNAVAATDPADRAAALAAAHVAAAEQPWVVRAAIAFAFPDDEALWTEVDAATLRHADVEFPSRANIVFGVMAAMRRAPVRWALDRALEFHRLVAPAAVIAHLGEAAVGPLRLLHAFDELGQLGTDDALRALAEFADRAPEPLIALRPGERAIRALAPLFTSERPRRTLGLPLARGLLAEMCAGAPAEAAAIASGRGDDARLIEQLLAGTGATLPADDWRSPWRTGKSARKRAADRIELPPIAVPFEERIHGAPPALLVLPDDERTPAYDLMLVERCAVEAATGSTFMNRMRSMTDATALRTWSAIARDRWSGQAEDVEHMLGRFGLDILPSLLEWVHARSGALPGFSGVESPRVAPVMARAFAVLPSQADTGRAWLERFPIAAVIGLAPQTAAKAAKERDIARKALAHVVSRHRAVVGDLLARAGVTVDLDRLDVPAALPARRPPMPAFLDAAVLPRPIRRDGQAALDPAAIADLLALAKATLPGPSTALDDIAARYTPESLAKMAWSAFRQWLFAGAPPKEKWALYAVGRFPDDDSARALGKLAREWAPIGLSARAQLAVDALALMNTQTALLEIHDIARRAPSKAFKARAQKVFKQMAGSLHLSEEELADRLVPDVSEDDLTFGNLRVELDTSLRPHLVDAEGGVHDAPPRGEAGDGKRWTELKKLCTRAARAQIPRLERAMAEGRRMAFEHFGEIYLVHLLLRFLARGVVWGAYRRGELAFAFRVTADGCVDVDGAARELALDHDYGVVHPIELAEPELAAWQRQLPEQPFEQLARAVYPADDLADCQRRLAEHAGTLVLTPALLGMRARGWERGPVEQGGVYVSIERAGDGWSATIEFAPGIHLGSPGESALQRIERVELRADPPPPLALLSDIQRDLALVTVAA